MALAVEEDFFQEESKEEASFTSIETNLSKNISFCHRYTQ